MVYVNAHLLTLCLASIRILLYVGLHGDKWTNDFSLDAFQEEPENISDILIDDFWQHDSEVSSLNLLRPHVIQIIRHVILLDHFEKSFSIFIIGQAVLHRFEVFVLQRKFCEGFVEDVVDDFIFIAMLT